MSALANVPLEWVKSSLCSGGDCVKVASIPGGVVVRDLSGSVLRFTPGGWRVFTAELKEEQ